MRNEFYSILIALAIFCTPSFAQEAVNTNHLYSQTVLFGSTPIDLVITRSDPTSLQDHGINAAFTNKSNKKLKVFELASPVVPSAKAVFLDLGKDTPPTIEVSLTGGADGSSYHFMYLFSLVNDDIVQTFKADYEDNYYFRKAECGELKIQPDGTYQLVEESVLKLKTSKLQWNKKLKRFERKDTKAIPMTLTALSSTKLHEKPSFKLKPIKTVDKGTNFTLISDKQCSQKEDGDACDPINIESSEKARWFKVEDTDKKRYWIWENQALESNLTCNAPMDNSLE